MSFTDWLKPAPPVEKVLPTDAVVRCPACHSDRAMPSLLILRRFVLREGRLVSFIDGDRLACQECGCVFSVDSHGTFRQSANAVPYSPVGDPHGEFGLTPPEAPPEAPRPPILPMPLRRPSV